MCKTLYLEGRHGQAESEEATTGTDSEAATEPVSEPTVQGLTPKESAGELALEESAAKPAVGEMASKASPEESAASELGLQEATVAAAIESAGPTKEVRLGVQVERLTLGAAMPKLRE